MKKLIDIPLKRRLLTAYLASFNEDNRKTSDSLIMLLSAIGGGVIILFLLWLLGVIILAF